MERLLAEKQGIQVYLEEKGDTRSWKVVYGPRKRVYQTYAASYWEWAFHGHYGEMLTHSQLAEGMTEDYIAQIEQNPLIDSDSLVRSLVERANSHFREVNERASDDPGNPYYDSAECRHWTDS